MRVEHSFDPINPDPRTARWIVYVSENVNTKGVVVGSCSFEDRTVEFEWREGHVWITVVPEFKDGTTQNWLDPSVLRSEVTITGRTSTPPSPANATVGQVDPTMMGRVIFDPPAQSEVGSYVQVIEGPSESLGKLLAEVQVRPRGPTFPDGSRLPSESFPIEGGGVTTRDVIVRAMGMAGNPASTPVSRAVAVQSRDVGYAIAIASVSGSTVSGFPAAAATDGWEYAVTDGMRMRQIPTGAAITTDWGTPSSGLLSGCGAFARYVDRATIESNEFNLGSNVTFVLEILDTLQRKSNAGGLTSVKAAALSWLPVAQIRDETRRGEATGPRWLARETKPAGTPRQPLRHCRWEYVIGTSASVAHTDADYLPYIPGQVIRGQYGRVRLKVREETGWHQIICPTITVRAIVQDVVSRTTADVTVANTTTKTDLISHTVPPSSLGTSRGVEVLLMGAYLNNSGSADAPALEVVYGATTMFAASFSTAIAANANWRPIVIRLVLQADGGAVAQVMTGTLTLSPPAAAGTGLGGIDLVSTSYVGVIQGTATEDSTASKALAVKWTHGAAHASLSIVIKHAIVRPL